MQTVSRRTSSWLFVGGRIGEDFMSIEPAKNTTRNIEVVHFVGLHQYHYFHYMCAVQQMGLSIFL